MILIEGQVSQTDETAQRAPVVWSESNVPGGSLRWQSRIGELTIRCDASYQVAHFDQGIVIHDGRVDRWQSDPRSWNGSFLALERCADDPDVVMRFYTDRLGTIPVYWGRAGHALHFASKLSRLAARGFTRPDALAGWQLVLFNSPLWQRSLLSGVELLPPASGISVSHGGKLECRRYWQAPANPEPGGDAGAALDALVAALRLAHQRSSQAGIPILFPVTGGLDSRMNLALHLGELAGARLFHCYSKRNAEGPIAKKIAARLGQPLSLQREVESILQIPYLDPDNETGELNAAQWWLDRSVATVAERWPGHALMDGYMMDVLFNPRITRADAEPATLAHSLGGARYRYRQLRRNPDDPHLGEMLELFRSEYALEHATSPLQASQRYYLENRSRRFVFGTTRLAQNYLPVLLPGIDSELLEFGFSLPWGLRTGGRLYRQAIVRLAPALAALAYDKSGLPLTSRRQISTVRYLKDNIVANLDRVWPKRWFVRGPDADLANVMVDHPEFAEAIQASLLASSWVSEILGGPQHLRAFLEGQRKRCDAGETIYGLLTLAKLEGRLSGGAKPPNEATESLARGSKHDQDAGNAS